MRKKRRRKKGREERGGRRGRGTERVVGGEEGKRNGRWE